MPRPDGRASVSELLIGYTLECDWWLSVESTRPSVQSSMAEVTSQKYPYFVDIPGQ